MKIDLLNPATFASGHPLEQYRWLRANAPVYRHAEPDGPGFWAVTRYDDVYEVDRDYRRFSSEPTIMIRDSPETDNAFGDYKMMLMMDPPQHMLYRRLIRSEFLPDPARAMAPWMQALATQIVDRVVERGACDFVEDVAGEMPSFVIAHLMGLPLEDGRELYKLTEIIHTAPEALPEGAGAQAVQKMFEYGARVIAEKRARPADDLATKLLQAEVEGKRLDDMEFLLFFLLLVDAGGDTTRNLLSSGLIALLDHPEQLAWLRADLDARLPAAREELLRFCTPVTYMRRTATEDTVLAGQRIAAGDKVVMYFPSANRDERRFADPDALDLGRAPNEHVSFGNGPHVCLGQHIARVEIDAMLREVLVRLPDIERTAAPEWLQSNFICGPKHMPVRFTPGRRVA
ncbi:cytochrome P450 [Zavarzinia sp. CC-PAN008]|uniref:cytochrome P450 n=1 Tax=Zavarzinia sp. CC-PAN008 TaxID=3243332 RepID=UPI003F744D2B